MENLTQTLKRAVVLLLVGISISFLAMAQQTKMPLSDALEQIAKKYKAKFAYEHNLLNGKTAKTSALNNTSVEEILKDILYPNNLLFLYVSGNSYSIVARDARFFKNPETPAEPPKSTTAVVVKKIWIRLLIKKFWKWRPIWLMVYPWRRLSLIQVFIVKTFAY